MSAASALPYQLRPNKAVDRELFLSLLTRLAATLSIEQYHYIGLGGPFLEDFRLVHGRLGIKKMTSLEVEEQVHRRQCFNRPVGSLECIHSTLEDYLDQTDFRNPVILWFDYSDPKKLTSQIQRFATTVGVVPMGSILRITLNANPEALGPPAAGSDLLAWRLARFRERFGALCPSDVAPHDMSQKAYGVSLLRALRFAVAKEVRSFRDRKVVWALATHYRDGQAMVTGTLIVCEESRVDIEELVRNWEFCSTPEVPHRLDLPTLSSLERLTMESKDDAKALMSFELPKSMMGEDPQINFVKYYRIYPHFSRVEL